MNRTKTVTASAARMGLLLLVGCALGLGAALMLVRPAAAEVNGPCGATLNGVNVASVDSSNRDNDIKVSQDASVPFLFTSDVGFVSHKIQLEFLGRWWTVSDKNDNGARQFSDSANVQDYATYGVGLYTVVGVGTLANGTTCTGAATVDVSGDPLTTVAGAVAVGAVALGTVVGLASGVTSAAKRLPVAEAPPPASTGSTAAEDEQAKALEEDWYARRLQEMKERDQGIWGCWSAAIMMLLTLPFMAISGGGRSPAPPPPVPAPKRRRLPWRPRVTLVGLICGIVAGAGVVVLLQQYSIAYPTRNEFITVLVAGAVVYGLLLPTLAGTVRWMRANRRLAAIRRSA